MSTETTIDVNEAAYASLAQEFGDTQAKQQQEEPKPQTAAEPAPKAEEQPQPEKPRMSYEDLERHTRNLNGALAEARGETRQMRERLGQFEQVLNAIRAQRAQPQPQDEYEDPVVSELRTLKQTNQELQRRQAEIDEERTERDEAEFIGRNLTHYEQQFAATSPDYFEAVNHLVQSRAAEIAIMYPDDDPQVIAASRNAGFAHPSLWRNDFIRREAMNIGKHAMRNGQDPARIFYNLAAQRGYQRKAAAAPAVQSAPQAQKQAAPRIEAVKRGMEAPGSLSNGATRADANAEGFPSLEELADMYVSDPKKAEKTFARMQSAGLLG